MTLTADDAARAVFDRQTRTDPPVHTTVLFDTACVLGGSIAGLLAARVLADLKINDAGRAAIGLGP
jgi:hypothetical protein